MMLGSFGIVAKRYSDNAVGRPVIQQFAGGTDGHKSKSRGSSPSHQLPIMQLRCVDRFEGIGAILINGEQLVELMIRHDIGVKLKKINVVKDSSEDFFGEYDR